MRRMHKYCEVMILETIGSVLKIWFHSSCFNGTAQTVYFTVIKREKRLTEI